LEFGEKPPKQKPASQTLEQASHPTHAPRGSAGWPLPRSVVTCRRRTGADRRRPEASHGRVGRLQASQSSSRSGWRGRGRRGEAGRRGGGGGGGAFLAACNNGREAAAGCCWPLSRGEGCSLRGRREARRPRVERSGGLRLHAAARRLICFGLLVRFEWCSLQRAGCGDGGGGPRRQAGGRARRAPGGKT
jgi:hypothetical protein